MRNVPDYFNLDHDSLLTRSIERKVVDEAVYVTLPLAQNSPRSAEIFSVINQGCSQPGANALQWGKKQKEQI